MKAFHEGYEFTDDDVFNPQQWVAAGELDTERTGDPFLIVDVRTRRTIAVIFAEDSDDALNIAADNGKLTAYYVHESDSPYVGEPVAEYGQNAFCYRCEAFAVLRLPNPHRSFVASFNYQADRNARRFVINTLEMAEDGRHFKWWTGSTWSSDAEKAHAYETFEDADKVCRDLELGAVMVRSH